MSKAGLIQSIAQQWNALSRRNSWLSSPNNFRLSQFQLLGPNLDVFTAVNNDTHQTIFEQALWFAAPKSKISPSRKRMKHLKYHPKRINWVRCDKCGEPKLPHRICKERSDICAMREDEWEEYQVKKATEQKDST